MARTTLSLLLQNCVAALVCWVVIPVVSGFSRTVIASRDKRRQTIGDFGEGRLPLIADGEQRRAHRPRNRQRRIVPGDPELALGIVEVGALIFDLRDR